MLLKSFFIDLYYNAKYYLSDPTAAFEALITKAEGL